MQVPGHVGRTIACGADACVGPISGDLVKSKIVGRVQGCRLGFANLLIEICAKIYRIACIQSLSRSSFLDASLSGRDVQWPHVVAAINGAAAEVRLRVLRSHHRVEAARQGQEEDKGQSLDALHEP